MAAAANLVGAVFGRLTVVARVGSSPEGVLWRCVCVCGKENTTTTHMLRSGNTRSCGCLNRDVNTKHGDIGSAEYAAWSNMRSRCFQSSYRLYKDYGGRGITVCERWDRYENFLSDMGRRPSPQHSLDRVDTNGNYEPSNCRWATTKEQARNTRQNVFAVVRGERLCLADVASRYRINLGTIRTRFKKGLRGEELIGPLKKQRKVNP